MRTRNDFWQTFLCSDVNNIDQACYKQPTAPTTQSILRKMLSKSEFGISVKIRGNFGQF